MFISKIEVMGDSNIVYAIHATEDGMLICECPAFRFSVGEATCKHIRFAERVLVSER